MSGHNMPGHWEPGNTREAVEVVTAKRGPCPWVPPHQCDVPKTRGKLPEGTECYIPGNEMPCVVRARFGNEAIAEAMKNI